eukprot:763252-Hanusia_phi.AAC.8
MQRKCDFDGKAARVLAAFIETAKAHLADGKGMQASTETAEEKGVKQQIDLDVPCTPEEWMSDLKRFVKLKDFQSIMMVLTLVLILGQIKEAKLDGNEVLCFLLSNIALALLISLRLDSDRTVTSPCSGASTEHWARGRPEGCSEPRAASRTPTLSWHRPTVRSVNRRTVLPPPRGRWPGTAPSHRVTVTQAGSPPLNRGTNTDRIYYLNTSS